MVLLCLFKHKRDWFSRPFCERLFNFCNRERFLLFLTTICGHFLWFCNRCFQCTVNTGHDSSSDTHFSHRSATPDFLTRVRNWLHNLVTPTNSPARDEEEEEEGATESTRTSDTSFQLPPPLRGIPDSLIQGFVKEYVKRNPGCVPEGVAAQPTPPPSISGFNPLRASSIRDGDNEIMSRLLTDFNSLLLTDNNQNSDDTVFPPGFYENMESRLVQRSTPSSVHNASVLVHTSESGEVVTNPAVVNVVTADAAEVESHLSDSSQSGSVELDRTLTEGAETAYRTRSGRVVKPREIFDL